MKAFYKGKTSFGKGEEVVEVCFLVDCDKSSLVKLAIPTAWKSFSQSLRRKVLQGKISREKALAILNTPISLKTVKAPRNVSLQQTRRSKPTKDNRLVIKALLEAALRELEKEDEQG